jgi:hypothetical protein
MSGRYEGNVICGSAVYWCCVKTEIKSNIKFKANIVPVHAVRAIMQVEAPSTNGWVVIVTPQSTLIPGNWAHLYIL